MAAQPTSGMARRGTETISAVPGRHARTRPDAPFPAFEREPGEILVHGISGHTIMTAYPDMIERAGENVASGEVERVVSEYETGSGGVTGDDILAHCRERMAMFTVPDVVEVVDELPRTSVGKIQKHLLRRSHSQ